MYLLQVIWVFLIIVLCVFDNSTLSVEKIKNTKLEKKTEETLYNTNAEQQQEETVYNTLNYNNFNECINAFGIFENITVQMYYDEDLIHDKYIVKNNILTLEINIESEKSYNSSVIEIIYYCLKYYT